MYVCICKGITDTQIKDAVIDGAASVRQVRKKLGATSQCGKCTSMTRQVVNEALAQHCQPEPDALFYAVA